MKKLFAAVLCLMLLLSASALAQDASTCTHPNAVVPGMKDQGGHPVMESSEYEYTDELWHKWMYDVAFEYICPDCSEPQTKVYEHEEDEEWLQDPEYHSFYLDDHNSNTCVGCKYTDPNFEVGKHAYILDGECPCGAQCSHESMTSTDTECPDCGMVRTNKLTMTYIDEESGDEWEEQVEPGGVYFTALLEETGFTAPADKPAFWAWYWVESDEDIDPDMDIYPVIENATFKAVWYHPDEDTVNVTFDKNGGIVNSNGEMEPGKQLISRKFFVPGTAYSAPADKSFAGWYDGTTLHKTGTLLDLTQDTTFKAIWSPIVLTFDMNGGEAIAPIEIEDDVTANLPAAPTLSGHEFLGWEIGGETKAAGALVTATTDMTVKALWGEKSKYTIRFDGNGASNTMDETSVYVDDNEYTLPASTFERAGYEFAGWKVNGEGETIVPADGAKISVTANTTLVAQWNCLHDNAVAPDVDAPGGELVGGSHEEKDRFVHEWTYDVEFTYTCPDCQETLTYTYYAVGTMDETHSHLMNKQHTSTSCVHCTFSDAQLQQGQHLYDTNGMCPCGERCGHPNMGTNANCPDCGTPNVLTMTYQDGYGNTFTEQVAMGGRHVILTLEETGLTVPSGKAFWCWRWEEEDEDIDPEGDIDPVLNHQTFTAVWYTPGTDLVVTAKFDANGGSGSMPDGQHLRGRGPFTAPPGMALTAPANKSFAGWFDPNWNVLRKPGDQFDLAQDTTFKAVWAPIVISYDMDGGEAFAPETLEDDVVIYTLRGAPVRDGFEFLGWEVDGVQKAAQTAIYVTKDTTVKALWRPLDSWAVSFNGNGAEDTMETVYVREDSATYTLPESTFTYAGYVFNGWLVGNETTAKQPGETITLTGSTTLTAQWRQLGSYTVTFDGNGASNTMAAATVLEGSPEYLLPASTFTRTGYTFAGWKVNGEGETIVPADGAKISVTANTTLVAQWQPITYTVTLKGNNGEADITIPADYGTQYVIEGCNFTPPTDTPNFDGWTVNGEKRNIGDKITITGDMTIEATWAKDEFTQTFLPGEADGTPYTGTSNYGKSYTLPECKFERDGYKFIYWENSVGETFEEGFTFTLLHADETFIAIWEQLPIKPVEEKLDTEIIQKMDDAVVSELVTALKVENVSADATEEEIAQAVVVAIENTLVEAAIDAGFGTVVSGGSTDSTGSTGSTSGSTDSGSQKPVVEVEMKVVDVTPYFVDEKTGEKTKVDPENFPINEGLLVTFDLPAGVSADAHDIVVLHMITTNINGTGLKIGDVEQPDVVSLTSTEITVRFHSLSPVAIVWKEKDVPGVDGVVWVDELPETGDSSSLLLWSALLAMSGAAALILKKRRA